MRRLAPHRPVSVRVSMRPNMPGSQASSSLHCRARGLSACGGQCPVLMAPDRCSLSAFRLGSGGVKEEGDRGGVAAAAYPLPQHTAWSAWGIQVGPSSLFGRWWFTCQCLQQVSYSCLLLLRCEVKVQRLGIAAPPARDGQAQRHSGCTRSMRFRNSPQFVQQGTRFVQRVRLSVARLHFAHPGLQGSRRGRESEGVKTLPRALITNPCWPVPGTL